MAEGTRNWVLSSGGGPLTDLAREINTHYLADESECVRQFVERACLEASDTESVLAEARRLVGAMRARREHAGGLDALLGEYSLSSREGVVLMCLAEALLRIPDAETADRLIADKLGEADFHSHLGTSESLFVNMATWGLMLTGEVVRQEEVDHTTLASLFGSMLNRLGEPVIRTAMRQAMRIMGHQFITGRTIEAALEHAGKAVNRAYRYSFDMLGEAALSRADAERFLGAYAHAIEAIGAAVDSGQSLIEAPGISVKLSALSPRFEMAQAARARSELVDRVGQLARLARDAGITLTIDAEEASRLELTLLVFDAVFRQPALSDWSGLGLAVQAYQKRAPEVIEWLNRAARSERRPIPVRLVKGAYWDTEIKLAQQLGLEGYPVFTRKSSTDVAFLGCARQLIEASPRLYPQFATHNAHTAAWVMHVGRDTEFEFQRLHGMGEELYDELVGCEETPRPCRVYAPVGAHHDLLPYLVRRLLENGANTSFVNRFVDDELSIDELVRDPVADTLALGEDLAHPRIALPEVLYGTARRNSEGLNLADPLVLERLAHELRSSTARYEVAPIVGGAHCQGEKIDVTDRARGSELIGTVRYADATTAKRALDAAYDGFSRWSAVDPHERARILRLGADLLEAHRAEIVRLCVAEAGRTIPDSLAEVREAVDFLRYYGAECERLFGQDSILAGPTGEENRLRYSGRGVFACISPWNFPAAIFTGQIAAALAGGNTVIAKPAEQTPITGSRIVELLHKAGVPGDALQFLPGSGPVIGAAILSDPRVAGVAFTGSTATAQQINRQLAGREGPIAALVAETGGINAMIVDTSALAEQVIRDVVRSAFNSAGQRCSALRLLCLPDETADALLAMLEGAMGELVVGDPALIETDVGPVIDKESHERLVGYYRSHAGRIVAQCLVPGDLEGMTYVPPTVLELDSASDLVEEVFGPILHVVRYEPSEIDALVDELNDVGYGLTLGIHSRIGTFAARVADRARVGNVYVNRDMIGAVVGVQAFGGLGKSGTGPKAGGPNYLARFAVEQMLTTNTAAVGGNATLLTMEGTD